MIHDIIKNMMIDRRKKRDENMHRIDVHDEGSVDQKIEVEHPHEIADAVKGQLKPICDAMVCPERGDRARCYIDIFQYCPLYDCYTRKTDGGEKK